MHFACLTSIVPLALLAAAIPQPAVERKGTAIPITKRSRLVNADETVDFNALHSHVASVRAKILRGLDSYKKNTGTMHPSAVKGVGKRGYGETLTDYNDILWYGDITIGTPPVTVTVQFDTGSCDLFVASSLCDSSCGGHTLWDPSSSSSAEDNYASDTLLFGAGDSVDVEEFTDTVSIGTFTATSQTLGAVSSYSSQFQSAETPADGVMGMAFQSISIYGASPLFQTLVSEGQATESVFSFMLTPSAAELYVGGSNTALYTGDFSYTPVTKQGFWQVNMENVQVNGQAILNNIDAIIDTGTTLIIGIPSDVLTMYNTLGGQPAPNNNDFYAFPCDAFPNIYLSFGGTAFLIPAAVLNIGPVYPDSNYCLSGIVSGAIDASFWVIGDIFLGGVYTVFDVGNSRVGFAQLA